MSRLYILFVALLCGACGPSLEDSVEKLGGSGEEREAAKQHLLLAKDRSVEPLLEALEEPRSAAARPELVEVLVSLMMRVDDARIEAALNQHLRTDPDPRVRARIARRMGMYKRQEAVESLLGALEDEEGEVRYQAILALEFLDSKLSEEQKEALQERARELLTDPHESTRMEAMIRVENFVNKWIREAQELAIKAQLAAAESLYTEALAYSPHSKQGHYRLARFYFDNGKEDKGARLLRRHGMLLDVPLLERAPELDGQLDEAVWEQAVRADSFYQFAFQSAALPSEVRTRAYVGYTKEALYVGFRGHDVHPDSLVVTAHEFDGDVWFDDIIELFLDANFDHKSYVHMGINSIGVVCDAWHPVGLRSRDTSWNADAAVAAYVGEDFWSLECELRFGQKELPWPRPGDIWGFNITRTFRGSEYSQWVRTYRGSNAHAPNDFALLVFN